MIERISYQPGFIAFVEQGVPVEELERRMRPGNYSRGGFLGQDERLLDVIAADQEVIKRLNVTHDQIADRIEYLLTERYFKKSHDQYTEAMDLHPDPDQFTTWEEYLEAFKNAIETNDKKARTMLTKGVVVDEVYRIRCMAYAGYQGCPYDNKIFSFYSSSDFAVENLRLREDLSFHGLIVHLIKEHHFYEGKQSPYRVEPEKACRVLDIPHTPLVEP